MVSQTELSTDSLLKFNVCTAMHSEIGVGIESDRHTITEHVEMKRCA